MSRLVARLAAVFAAMALPADALGADWMAEESDLRGAFYSEDPKDWTELGDQNDSMEFEFGVRYWYSWGAQNFNVGADAFTSSDKAHLGELHLRIDDNYTRTYVKGLAGYSIAIDGTYSNDGLAGSISDGRIGYLGADIGWSAFGNDDAGFGPLLGYLYWNDSPKTTRQSFTTADSSDDIGFDPDTGETFVPFDSTDNNLDIHALRLGLSGRAELGDIVDITAEIAAVPYAKVDGVLGGHGTSPVTCAPLGNICSAKSSETTVGGWGYGAMGEVMVGVTPVENLTFRIGGRAWYLQGTVDATYSQATIGDPTDSDPVNPPNYDTPPAFSEQAFITTANPFSLFRYGLLAEFTYSF